MSMLYEKMTQGIYYCNPLSQCIHIKCHDGILVTMTEGTIYLDEMIPFNFPAFFLLQKDIKHGCASIL